MVRSALLLLLVVAWPRSALAEPAALVIGETRLVLEVRNPVVVIEEASGWAITAPRLPLLWLTVRAAPCERGELPPASDAQLGFFPARPAAPPPSIGDRVQRWRAMCIDGDAWSLLVMVGYFTDDRPDREPRAAPDQESNDHVHEVLTRLRQGLRPPLVVLPGLAIQRDDLPFLVRAGDRPGAVGIDGVLLDTSIDDAPCAEGLAEGSRCDELSTQSVTVAFRDPVAGRAVMAAIREAEAQAARDANRATSLGSGGGAAPSSGPAAGPWDGAQPGGGGAMEAQRAAVQEAPAVRGRGILQVRDRIAKRALELHGAATWIVETREYTPPWANAQLPLHRLPGRWKLTDGTSPTLHAHSSRGGDLLVTPGSCATFRAAPGVGARVERPRFFPGAPPVTWVEQQPRWVARSCFAIAGVEALVSLSLATAPTTEEEAGYAAALTEVIDSTRLWSSGWLGSDGHSLGLGGEIWVVGSWISVLMQLEGMFGLGDEDAQTGRARAAIAAGIGYSRPAARAAILAGIGAELVPLRKLAGRDSAGGAAFLEGRAMGGRGRLMVQVIARGSYYFDIDCDSNAESDELCGRESDHSDFAPLLGGELELRVGGNRVGGYRSGGFLGLRYDAIWTGEAAEHHGLLSLGIMYW
jgi:hypothetical protein